ncbi:50S ribosome-binding GTPase [Spirulina major CS-329]|uniref:GTPase family protein n=1 Tax=Spirulina TaxID=1154 RepID=UPI0023303A8F|nr:MULTISPECIES: GTPase [Spirulina]MDB9496169.1 50S ribosome-binding GTPase [Spirulina subsalsa CS-330]MDB9501601.1 50S ribosome-binding GTPase [Spirulina major CS-329]
MQNDVDQPLPSLRSIEGVVTNLLGFLEALPKFTPRREEIIESLKNIRSAIQSQRPPRIMMIGRTNSGKSSLINAICGSYVTKVDAVRPQAVQPEWKSYYHNGVDLVEVLDTEGFQAQQSENERDASFQKILNAVKKNYPDVILFVHPAHSVNAAIQSDIESAEKIVKHIFKCHYIRIPVIGVLTQVDNMNPKEGLDDPDSQKRRNIGIARNDLFCHLQQNQVFKLIDVVPVCSYVEFEEAENGLPIAGKDYRWNIDELTEKIIQCTPKEMRGGFARMATVKEFQLSVANKMVNSFSVVAGLSAATPIPGMAVPVVAALQAFMVGHIAWLGGYEFSEKSIENFLGATAFGVAGIADVGLKLIPGVGVILSGAANAATTYALGKLAVDYFITKEGQRETSQQN